MRIAATRFAGIALVVGSLASTSNGAMAAASNPSAPFDGAWLYTRDGDDPIATAFAVSGSSLLYLAKEGTLYSFSRGWWTVNSYAAPDADGLYHVKTELGEPEVIDGPIYENESSEIEVRLDGPDRGEVYIAGDPKRRGVMQRIDCTPAVLFVDRRDPPPAGCKWAEIRGLGYDGLTGDCRWDEDWAMDWDKIRADADGVPNPAACLLAVPVAFPD